jgi:acetolactate synthase-1/2/3 large subunit
MSEKSTGAEIFVRSLAAEGVKHVFGYPGATLLPIYDMMERHDIRHVLTRHEAGSVHAAAG